MKQMDANQRKDNQDRFTASKKTKKMFKTEAAIIIQRAFRNYMRKKKVKALNNRIVLKLKSENQSLNPKGGKILELFRVRSRFLPLHKRGDSTNKTAPSGMGQNLLGSRSLFQKDGETVLVFGGTDNHTDFGVGRNTGKNIYRYCATENTWEFVGELPEPRHHHSVEFLKGRIFLVGGADPSEEFKGNYVILDSMWSFDPVAKNWFSEPCLGEARKNFGLVSHHQNLYAIGGQGRNFESLKCTEKFSLDEKLWEPVAPMLHPRISPACAKNLNYIFVAGGLSGNKNKRTLLDSVESYNVMTDQWTNVKQPLPFPRFLSCMLNLGEKIYLIGGVAQIEDKTVKSLGNIDVWDPETVEWKTVTEIHIPRHGHSIAYFGTQILVIGGVTTTYKRALTSIECFCSERGTLIRGVAGLPIGLTGHASITLPPASLLTH